MCSLWSPWRPCIQVIPPKIIKAYHHHDHHACNDFTFLVPHGFTSLLVSNSAITGPGDRPNEYAQKTTSYKIPSNIFVTQWSACSKGCRISYSEKDALKKDNQERLRGWNYSHITNPRLSPKSGLPSVRPKEALPLREYSVVSRWKNPRFSSRGYRRPGPPNACLPEMCRGPYGRTPAIRRCRRGRCRCSLWRENPDFQISTHEGEFGCSEPLMQPEKSAVIGLAGAEAFRFVRRGQLYRQRPVQRQAAFFLPAQARGLPAE